MTQRDLDRLKGLHPILVQSILAISEEMKANGSTIFVVEGMRTVQRQQELYAVGRTRQIGARVVTFKDGVVHRSNHQPHADGFGYAVDCAFFPTAAFGDPFDLRFPWEAYGELGEKYGLIWGGRWRMGDHPHLELPEGVPLGGLKA